MTLIIATQDDNHVATHVADGKRYGHWWNRDWAEGSHPTNPFYLGIFCPGRWFGDLPLDDDQWGSRCGYFYFRVHLEPGGFLEIPDVRFILNWYARNVGQPPNEGWELEDLILEVACNVNPIVTPLAGTNKSNLDNELATAITPWVRWTNDLVDTPGQHDGPIVSDNLASIVEVPLRKATWQSGNYIKMYVRARFANVNDVVMESYADVGTTIADGDVSVLNSDLIEGSPNSSGATSTFTVNAQVSNSILAQYNDLDALPGNKVVIGIEVDVKAKINKVDTVRLHELYIYDTVSGDISSNLAATVQNVAPNVFGNLIYGNEWTSFGIQDTNQLNNGNVRVRLTYTPQAASLPIEVETDTVHLRVWYHDPIPADTDSMIFRLPYGRGGCFHTWPDDEQKGLDHALSPALNITVTELLETDVEHFLDVQQFFHHPWKLASLEDELDLEQEFTVQQVHCRNIEQGFDIEQDIAAARARDYEQTIQHDIFFEQEIDGGRVLNRSYTHELDLEQQILFSSGFNQQIEHIIDFEQDIVVGRVLEFEVRHLLSLFQMITRSSGPVSVDYVHTLDLEQEFAIDPSSIIQNPEYVEDTLELDHDVPAKPVFTVTRGIEHFLDLQQVFVVIDPRTGECKKETIWAPDSNEEEFADEPVIALTSTLTLEYPATGSPTNTVTLPAPILTNREELDSTRIQRQSRGGEHITHRQDNWPQLFTFRFKFEDLTDQQQIDIFDFLGPSLGQEVKLIDHEGRHWIGLLVNPNGQFINIFRLCGTSAEFDFRGSCQRPVQQNIEHSLDITQEYTLLKTKTASVESELDELDQDISYVYDPASLFVESNPTTVDDINDSWTDEDDTTGTSNGLFSSTPGLDIFDTHAGWLAYTGFDFSSIPDSATITKIRVVVRCKDDNDLGCLLLVAFYENTTIESNALQSVVFPSVVTDAFYDGNNSLWGLSDYTPSFFKSANFVLRVDGLPQNISGSTLPEIDHVMIRIDYEL